jgi:hypothetical protein
MDEAKPMIICKLYKVLKIEIQKLVFIFTKIKNRKRSENVLKKSF